MKALPPTAYCDRRVADWKLEAWELGVGSWELTPVVPLERHPHRDVGAGTVVDAVSHIEAERQDGQLQEPARANAGVVLCVAEGGMRVVHGAAVGEHCDAGAADVPGRRDWHPQLERARRQAVAIAIAELEAAQRRGAAKERLLEDRQRIRGT